jgi:hypothetical protein
MFSLSRARRRRAMMRRLAELDRIDARYGLGADPGRVPPPTRTRHRRDATLASLLTVVVMTGFVLFDPSAVGSTTRGLLGLSPEPPYTVPLLDPGDGTYAFMHEQPGSSAPVAYDPCRVIEVAINPDGAPDDYQEYVDVAIEHVSEPSGLRFEVVEETDDRPGRDPRGRGGAGWSPVLVAWADEDEVPGLTGDVAGLGGSTAVKQPGYTRYVTGSVTLDVDVFDRLPSRLGGQPRAQAIVDHEFGHLVGLDHVDDPGELMHAENNGRTSWGPGDLAGLSRLGRGRCS